MAGQNIITVLLAAALSVFASFLTDPSGAAEKAAAGVREAAVMAEEAAAAAAMEEENSREVILGDAQTDLYLPLLEGKRTALFSNQSGIVGNMTFRPGEADSKELESEETVDAAGSEKTVTAEEEIKVNASADTEEMEEAEEAEQASGGMPVSAENIPFGQAPDGTSLEYGPHILDVLVENGVDVTVVFSPEHGFRGDADAGAQIGDSVDEKTGIQVRSLYGSSAELTGRDLDRFDTLVVDIQDVGLRYYTYYITLYYLMDACAAAGKEVVILDRPNPNGFYVDGPVLREEFRSGVGLLPLPVVHGMTLGELAQMINGEGWLTAGKDACHLTVIPCEHYTHQKKTSLVVRPSPNLKDMRAVWLYSSTCIFENTVASVGRGTEYPFTIYGSPYFEGLRRVGPEEGDIREDTGYYSYSFTPVSMQGATSPPFMGQTCYGRSLRDKPVEQIWEEQIHLEYLIDAYRDFHAEYPDLSFFGTPDGAGHYWIDTLCGTDDVRRRIEAGETAAQIKESWQEELAAFRKQREPYLLYAE